MLVVPFWCHLVRWLRGFGEKTKHFMVILDMPASYPGGAVNEAVAVLSSE